MSDTEYSQGFADYGDSEDDLYGDDLASDVEIEDQEEDQEMSTKRKSQKELDNFASLVSLDPYPAMCVLNKFKFVDSQASQKWFEDSTGIAEELKLYTEPVVDCVWPNATADEDDTLCVICYTNTVVNGEGASAPACGHGMCKDCWKSHFEMKVKTNAIFAMDCMMCNKLVTMDFLEAHMTPETFTLFHNRIMENLANGAGIQAPCKGKNCTKILDVSDVTKAYKECGACLWRCCTSCHEEYHEPVDCESWKEWQAKMDKDAPNLLWISQNTKQCPKCRSPIQKNGGCQHMTCKSCRHEFCWLCNKDWKTHGGYQCNTGNGDAPGSNRGSEMDARNKKKWFLFCVDRYADHRSNVKSEQGIRDKFCRRAAKLLDSQGTMGTRVLDQAISALHELHVLLANVYVYSYFYNDAARSEGGMDSGLFSYHVERLESHRENLAVELQYRLPREDMEKLRIRINTAVSSTNSFLEFFRSSSAASTYGHAEITTEHIPDTA